MAKNISHPHLFGSYSTIYEPQLFTNLSYLRTSVIYELPPHISALTEPVYLPWCAQSAYR